MPLWVWTTPTIGAGRNLPSTPSPSPRVNHSTQPFCGRLSKRDAAQKSKQLPDGLAYSLAMSCGSGLCISGLESVCSHGLSPLARRRLPGNHTKRLLPVRRSLTLAPHAPSHQVGPRTHGPTTAPNGQPWPHVAGYVKGYKKLHVNGLSKVTVDNTGNDSDVFVKLVSLDGAEAYPVRVFFVSARSQFKLNSIRAGNYDIRYRDLDSGGLSRSEPFTLEQRETYDGIQYSNITMTLYKVARGNMQTYALSETEF